MRSVIVAALAFGVWAVLDLSPLSNGAAAANFSSINGSWRGSGRLRRDDGSSELLRCKAYYNAKDGGQRLGIAVRCASTSYKFEFRSQLALNGNQIVGSWEERNNNAEGDLSGTFKPGKIVLKATGAALAAINVEFSDTRQVITLAGDLGVYKPISLSFSK